MDTATALVYLRDARARVESVVGQDVRWYRPPYGDFSTAQARGIRKLGLELVIWSGDAFDWRRDEPRAIVERAIAGVFPGAILLLHDNRGDADPADVDDRHDIDRAWVTDSILNSVGTERYRSVTVGTLLSGRDRVRSVIRQRAARS